MSNARRVLIALGGVLLVAAIATGVLRWQAEQAASDYTAAVKANVARYEQVYKTTPELREALAKVSEATASLPKDIAQVPRAQKLGPPLGTLYVANTRILRREIADAPTLRSVPLGALLSSNHEAAQASSRAIDRGYARALQLSVAAAEFYPDFGAAYDRLSRVIIFAPLLAQTSKAISDLRKLGREAFGGSRTADLVAGVRDRVKNDVVVQKLVAETPLPNMYEPERQRILAILSKRSQAAEQVQAAVAAQDQAAFDAAAKVYDAGDEAEYVKAYLTMMQKVVVLSETFDKEAKAFEAQVAAL